MGFPHWDLVLSLLGAWTIAFFCMIKGIKSSGKVGFNEVQLLLSARDPYYGIHSLCFRELKDLLMNNGEMQL